MIKSAALFWLDDPLPSLRESLAHATARIPHYRERAAEYAGPLTSLADLARLPFIRPEEYAAAPERFAVPGLWPDLVTYSASTTGAIGRPRWHLQSELDALRDALPPVEDRGRATLVIHPYDQGGAQRPSRDPTTIFAPLLVPWHYEQIRRLLVDGWSTPAGLRRIDHIDAFSPALRILSVWLSQQGVDRGALGVATMTGYGSIQPPPWRRRLRREWGATYQDIYGLSEVKQSEAHACPICGAYHHHRPIVAETVDPEGGQPIERGFAVLVLSELRPFSEIQLLLRYWTDDIVEIAGPCMLADRGFFFRGRRRASVALARGSEGPIYVGPLQVGEILAEIADVAHHTYPWAAFAEDVGAPRFALRGQGRRVRVEVELRYAPALYPRRAAAAIDEARAGLLGSITGLAALIADGDATLEVVACERGSIADPAKV